MRDKEEVLEKFREVREAKLKERKQAYLCKASINCRHNARLRVKGKGQVGFCQNQLVLSKTTRGLFACDDETAARCKVFECKNDEASVEADFMEVLRSPARCGDEYPKLAMMIWFLQEFEAQGRWERLASLARKQASALWQTVSCRWW